MTLNNSEEVAIEDRRSKAWLLRVKGKTVRQIATELGVSVGTAHSDLAAVMERTRSESDDRAETHRALSLARLDRALDTIEEALRAQVPAKDPENPDSASADHDMRLKAIAGLLKLEERRAKLLGLDAPTKQEVSGPEGAPIPVDARSSLLDRLAGLVAGENAPGPAGSDPAKPDG